MALINLLGGNTSGKSLPATAQERVNLYYEVLPQQDKSQTVAYGWPGVKAAYLPLPAGSVRGFYSQMDSNNFYVAGSTLLYRYTAGTGGAPVSIAYPGTSFANAKRIYWSENQASSPPELLMMYNMQLIRLRLDTFVTNLVTMSAGGGIGLSFLANRFITGVPSSGKFAWSALNNGNSWPALNFATAESMPDGLVFQCVLRDNLVLFGSRSIEFWGPSPDLNLPFSRITVATNVGCASANSVAIGEDAIYFVGVPAKGSPRIYRLSGYDVEPISTPDIERILAVNYPGDDLLLTNNSKVWAGNYITFGGHRFYVLNGYGYFVDTLGYSLAYDESTGVWSKIKSGAASWQFDIAGQAYAPTVDDNFYVMTAVADSDSNVVYYIKDDTLTDVLTPQTSGGLLVRPQADTGTWREKSLTCPHIFDGQGLNKLLLRRVRLDMENPGTSNQFRVGLSISRDGGKTYGTEMLVDLDTDLGTNLRAEWRRLGIGRDFVFKFRFPDSGKIAIIGAYVETSLANK